MMKARLEYVNSTYNKEGSREERYDEVLQRSRCESDMPGDVLVACENAHFTSTSLSFPFFLSILIHPAATLLPVFTHVRVHILES